MTINCDICQFTDSDGTNYPCKYCTESDAVRTILKYYNKPKFHEGAIILLKSLGITWEELQQQKKNYCEEQNPKIGSLKTVKCKDCKDYKEMRDAFDPKKVFSRYCKYTNKKKEPEEECDHPDK
jgi:hypothetical protein